MVAISNREDNRTAKYFPLTELDACENLATAAARQGNSESRDTYLQLMIVQASHNLQLAMHPRTEAENIAEIAREVDGWELYLKGYIPNLAEYLERYGEAA